MRPTASTDAAQASPGHGLFTSGESPRTQWTVNTSKPVTYEVRLSPGLLDPADPTLADAGAPAGASRLRRRLLVTETRVHQLYGAQLSAYFAAQGVEVDFCVIDAHEQVKTMDTVFRVVAAMDRFGIARRCEPVIAVGGGVLTDIVGVASSLYRRSTPYVRVPTTLIGMIDAAIGAKTGVNFDRHKNRLGAYHPSSLTLIDLQFLRTLDERHIVNGLAEVLKIALVKDAELFELLVAHGRRLVAERFQAAGSADEGTVAGAVLRRAIHGMLDELQPNLWEQRLQRLVDYGHSFSPAIEMAALPELLHGEAVCIDMVFTTALARRRCLVTEEQQRRIRSLISDLNLPLWHAACTDELMVRALEDAVRHRDGRQRLPLPVGIGSACFVDDVSADELAEVLAHIKPLSSVRAGQWQA